MAAASAFTRNSMGAARSHGLIGTPFAPDVEADTSLMRSWGPQKMPADRTRPRNPVPATDPPRHSARH
ncbi:MAG: hypothetical protein Q4P23_08775, partial [Micrococcaceae bacterium]|nr:hypothetical protein [Micrococcaceae bacterium]